MAITDSFKNAVSAGDIRGIRIMMKDSLLVDPTFTEFSEMNKLAQNVNGLYEPHDGREINNDASAWNDNYMNKLMVQVVGNFAHERIDHLKEVVQYLRPVATGSQLTATSSRPALTKKPSIPATQPRSTDYRKQKCQDEHNGRIVQNRGAKIAFGVVAGGVVGGTIAAIAGGTVLVGATAGAVVAGAAVAKVTSKGRRNE